MSIECCVQNGIVFYVGVKKKIRNGADKLTNGI